MKDEVKLSNSRDPKEEQSSETFITKTKNSLKNKAYSRNDEKLPGWRNLKM